MLSVIILAEAESEAERLPGLLAALTPAAVEGLVREVLIVRLAPSALVAALIEEIGAKPAGFPGEAIAEAKSELLLVATPAWRPRPGWIEQLAKDLRDGRCEAVLKGERGRVLRRTPYAVLIPTAKAYRLSDPDLNDLRRVLRKRADRIA